MVVKAKPERSIEDFILKGGKVSVDKEPTKWTSVCLRIPNIILEEVDGKGKKRAGLTRTAWLLEAIQKHLEEN